MFINGKILYVTAFLVAGTIVTTIYVAFANSSIESMGKPLGALTQVGWIDDSISNEKTGTNDNISSESEAKQNICPLERIVCSESGDAKTSVKKHFGRPFFHEDLFGENRFENRAFNDNWLNDNWLKRPGLLESVTFDEFATSIGDESRQSDSDVEE